MLVPLFPLLWLFFCYSFLGWVLETAVSAVRLHRYVDRSVLFGPLCACYGITAVLLTVGLPELRGKEAAACRKRLDVHLRPEEHRKILLRLRQAAPCRGLDLRLRHGESGQVLPELRREEARERAAVPLRQVWLAAGGSAPSAEILPGMRRPV